MKNKVPKVIVIASFILVVFIFFAAEPTGEQAFFKPLSVSSITELNYDVSKNVSSEMFPFISKNYFGYYDKDGNVVFAKHKENEFSVCNTMWTSYEYISSLSGDYTNTFKPFEARIFSSSSEKLFSMPATGYIYLKNNRVFVFLPLANTVCEYDLTGKILWSHSMPGIITAFDCNSDFVVLGSSDGMISCLDKKGSEKFSFYPGGSKTEIIYGITISNDSKYIACISGLNDQRLILVEANDYHKTVFHKFLKKSFRNQATMFFDTEGKYLFAETADGIIILNTKEFHFTETGLHGKLMSNYIKTSKSGFGILTQNENNSVLTFFDLNSRQFAQSTFESQSSSMLQFENEFFLIINDKILKFSLNKQ